MLLHEHVSVTECMQRAKEAAAERFQRSADRSVNGVCIDKTRDPHRSHRRKRSCEVGHQGSRGLRMELQKQKTGSL